MQVPLSFSHTREQAQELLGNSKLPHRHAGLRALPGCRQGREESPRGPLRRHATLDGCRRSRYLELIDHAALLHELLRYGAGCSYETICDISNNQVADLIGSVAQDMRLNPPRRLATFQSQLVEASFAGQVLALADLLVEIEDYEATANQRMRQEAGYRAGCVVPPTGKPR